MNADLPTIDDPAQEAHWEIVACHFDRVGKFSEIRVPLGIRVWARHAFARGISE